MPIVICIHDFAKLALSFSSCLVDSLEFLTYKTMSYVIRDSFLFQSTLLLSIFSCFVVLARNSTTILYKSDGTLSLFPILGENHLIFHH